MTKLKSALGYDDSLDVFGVHLDRRAGLPNVERIVAEIRGIPGLEFSGAIDGIQIDVGKLLRGEFPIVGINAFGVSVKGDMFGGQLDAQLLGGMLKLDAAGRVIADLDTALAASHRRPVLIFKHSATCGLSGLAREEVQGALADPATEDVLTSMVVVQTHRDVSAAVTDRLRVWHASPQVLLLSDGKVHWHTSHSGIRTRATIRRPQVSS